MKEEARQNQDQDMVKCVECEKTVLKHAAYGKDGKYYCCPDCYEGKTCDCQ